MQKAIHCLKTQYNSILSLIVWNAILEIDLLRWYEQTNPSFFQRMLSPSKLNTSNSAHMPQQQTQGQEKNPSPITNPGENPTENDNPLQDYHPCETKIFNQIVPIHVPPHLALQKSELLHKQAENQGGGRMMYIDLLTKSPHNSSSPQQNHQSKSAHCANDHEGKLHHPHKLPQQIRSEKGFFNICNKQ